MNKKYAIFDMDGTLLCSMGYWRQLWREFLSLKGVDPIPDNMLERIKPLTMQQSAELFIKEFSLPGTPETVAREMHDLMGAHYANDVTLKEGAREYLDALRSKGVRMCIASATTEYLVFPCLERYGIKDHFEFVLSCEETGLGKHIPDIYLMAAERFSAKPEDIAVYEDAMYAARTAKQAGFYLVGVWDEVASRHWEEIKGFADETIADWREAKPEQG